MVSQFPPVRLILASSMRCRITDGVSLGPVANGAHLSTVHSLYYASNIHITPNAQAQYSGINALNHSPSKHSVQQHT